MMHLRNLFNDELLGKIVEAHVEKFGTISVQDILLYKEAIASTRMEHETDES